MGQRLGENEHTPVYLATLFLDNGALVHLCSTDTLEFAPFSEPEKLAIASLVEGYCHLFFEAVPQMENATEEDECDQGCVWCGNPELETGEDYQWCQHCRSGRFFHACPRCGGDLDASLDPLTRCRACGQQWGVVKGMIVNLAAYLRGEIQAPQPELDTLEELQRWVKALDTPFDPT
jgi:hypothetical protein